MYRHVQRLSSCCGVSNIFKLFGTHSHFTSNKFCFGTGAFIEDKKLPSNDRYKTLMDVIQSKISSRYYVDLRTIRKATNILANSDRMTEDDALRLLSLCGKKVAANSEVKLDQAQAIFESVENKSIKLFNQLLQIYVDSKSPFNNFQVLQRLKNLQLAPDSETFYKLIAGNCLLGKVGNAKEILMLLFERDISVPLDMYGYFAHALATAEYPDHAIMIIDQLLLHQSKLSWHVFSPLFCGLVNQEAAYILDTLKKYSANYKFDMTIYHALAIYRALLSGKKHSLISHFLKFYRVNRKDIVIAYHHMMLLPHSAAAHFLKELLLKFDGYYNKAKLPIIQYPILADCLQSGRSFEELWDTMMFLKKYDTNSNDMEYLTLLVILEFEPDLFRRFVDKLCENNISIQFPVPLELEVKLHIPKRKLLYLNSKGSKFCVSDATDEDSKIRQLS